MKNACFDRHWLQEKYSTHGAPLASIAEEAGCSYNTVMRRLRFFEIPRRPRSKINGQKTGPKPLHIPEQYLREQYIEQEKSMTQIAEAHGLNPTTIRNRLIVFGIPIRDQHYCKTANRVELTEDLLEYLDGTLLGDGCLVADTELSAYYTIAQKHLSYIEWVRDFFASHGIGQMGTINSWQSPKSPNLTYRYGSRYYRELREEYDRWYPGGVKHVPADVRLTPLSVRTWFLEDGCCGRKHGVRIAACGFTEEGVERLADGLRQRLNTPHVNTNTRGYISFGRKEIVRRFFEYVLPLQEELSDDYGYKYDTRGERK